jgi:glycosyltransferase involved in cell wall biosynthesis
MLIGIDGNEANQQNKVGIGQFAFNLINEISKNDKKNQYCVYLKDKPDADLPVSSVNWKYKILKPKKLWTQIALPINLFLQKEKLDLFFSPSHYSPRFSPCPTIVSIMDLWHHRHPEQFDKKDLYQLINWEKYSIKKAKKIITISEFSKKEIMDVYKIPKEEIIVAYPGFTEFRIKNKELRIKEIKEKYKINGDYLLYLGTLQPKKNLERLIQAFSLLITNYQSPITLVIAGKKGWLFEKIFKLVKELRLEEKVIFTGFITEEEKPYLIAGAKAFVFPSLYEGFGIPILEAMSLGIPVISSKEGSLLEIGGESPFYCNAYEVSDIAKKMAEVLNLNKSSHDEIIKQGFKNLTRFGWEKCAQKVLETFGQVTGD